MIKQLLSLLFATFVVPKSNGTLCYLRMNNFQSNYFFVQSEYNYNRKREGEIDREKYRIKTAAQHRSSSVAPSCLQFICIKNIELISREMS